MHDFKFPYTNSLLDSCAIIIFRDCSGMLPITYIIETSPFFNCICKGMDEKETTKSGKKERTRTLMSIVALSVLNVLKCILAYPAP